MKLVALADEKGASYWKAFGMIRTKVACLALTGKASDAVQMITSGIDRVAVNGSNICGAVALIVFGEAYAELGQFDDAWRCIGEAMTAIETTKERWCEAEVHRIAGEIALHVAGAGCGESGSVFRARARGRSSAASKVLGTPRRHEPRAPLARPGQGAASSRTASLRFTAGSPKGSTRAI